MTGEIVGVPSTRFSVTFTARYLLDKTRTLKYVDVCKRLGAQVCTFYLPERG